ncbi:MAG: sigma-70 family RNA polymerase sigma factor [bacterium]
MRAALVDICTPLVVGVASAYPTPNLRDDLIQEGFLGLLRAIERYDPGRGTPFLAFARYFIRGGVSHYLRDHRWLLRPGRSATQAPRTLSFGAVQDGERDGAVPPWVNAAGGRGESWDDRIALTDALAALPPLHRVVVFYSYFVGLTQVEVAGRVGISQKHVSRMIAGALLRLRSALPCAEQCGQAAYPASSS